MVELVGAQSSWIHRELAKTANIGTVVYDVVGSLGPRPVGECAYHIFQCAVEGFYKVEWLVQKAVCELAVVRSDLIDADLNSISIHLLVLIIRYVL